MTETTTLPAPGSSRVTESVVGLRTRPLTLKDDLLVADSGQFFRAGRGFAARLGGSCLSDADECFLRAHGLWSDRPHDLAHLAQLRGAALRSASPATLDYLILVPTLRCNLSCTYCQVSRADERSLGYDWTGDTLQSVLGLIGSLTAPSVKIEFQGGEPTLRCDLIEAVIQACARFDRAEFVICTNLARLEADTIALFDRPNVVISTSLDGSAATHQKHRTQRDDATAAFTANLDMVLDRYGPEKVSALPTIDPANPPPIDELIEAYASRGLTHIFLRPINYQGFARKRHAEVREQSAAWFAYHEAFVRALIARNWSDRSRVLDESYLTLCLRRVFQPGHDRHVDLRNPNPVGVDYIVIDHDGAVYPTDEARMLTRAGVVDLRIGDVATGWDSETRQLLSHYADNRLDPTCNACAYQPYCGRDVIDDLARYGRIDLPRHETEFCRRHQHMFDLAFRLIYDPDPAVQHSIRRWLGLRGDSTVLGATL